MPSYPVVDPSHLVQCSDHMCPIRVHWHIKTNYKEHWRVKLTVSNYHYGANYSDWNVMVQHPGFGEEIWAFNFNNTKLDSDLDNAGELPKYILMALVNRNYLFEAWYKRMVITVT